MSWLVKEPRFADGDTSVWRTNANREASPLWQVGGRLFLSRRQLVFQPNRLIGFLTLGLHPRCVAT